MEGAAERAVRAVPLAARPGACIAGRVSPSANIDAQRSLSTVFAGQTPAVTKKALYLPCRTTDAVT